MEQVPSNPKANDCKMTEVCGENLLVKCTDGVTRRGRIRGKLKRRVWIRDNDIVIIAPWEFGEGERGDILWRYTLPQTDWLKANDHIPKDF